MQQPQIQPETGHPIQPRNVLSLQPTKHAQTTGNPDNSLNLPRQFSLGNHQTLQHFHYKRSENPRTISWVSYCQFIPRQYPRNPKKIQLIPRTQKNKPGARNLCQNLNFFPSCSDRRRRRNAGARITIYCAQELG